MRLPTFGLHLKSATLIIASLACRKSEKDFHKANRKILNFDWSKKHKDLLTRLIFNYQWFSTQNWMIIAEKE